MSQSTKSAFSSSMYQPCIRRSRMLFAYEQCPFWKHKTFFTCWGQIEFMWCNLTTNQRGPYYTCVNKNSPLGFLSWQWDATDEVSRKSSAILKISKIVCITLCDLVTIKRRPHCVCKNRLFLLRSFSVNSVIP